MSNSATYLETSFRQRAINNQKALDEMKQDAAQAEYDEICRNLLLTVRSY